ncbi:MAG: PBP1A family penicillin-binding protein [Candidatus Pacebacteria bacterium]|nr:PBP1A family penicillin-binding protein [Candidatus Paceibacterota bacterium]
MQTKHIHTRHKIRNFLLVIIALGTALGFIVVGLFLLWASTLPIPTISAIEEQRKEQSTKIYDRTGEVLLYDMHQDVRRTFMPLDQMADHVKHATIAIEDERFYKHFGVEPLSVLRAVMRNLQHGDLFSGQGGSTLTQQIIKNTLLSQEKTVTRKLKEWILAVKLEQILSKDQILELYLNEAPYGGTKYGVEEASQGFFGKTAKDLTIAESAYVAALPQAPTYYSPYGNNRVALDARKDTVLTRMREQGYISPEEYDGARAEVVTFRPQTGASIKAPHFVFYVIDQLSKTYGDADLARANLRVITTLDWELQREAESIVYEKAHENAKTYNARNASLMAIDPKTGGILVMVGSRDYFDEEIDGNYNIGLAQRQPGSSFKPFAYAAAIEKGYTSETVVYDVHTQFSTSCNKSDLHTGDGCYSPQNYDNIFRGPMTLREALAQSVNVPAVKVLYLAGTKNTISLARRMGVTSLDPGRDYGLTLVLGGGEVSLLEMTSAYGVFAHEGYRYPHTSIQEVRDADGKVLEKLNQKGELVLSAEVANTITDMLADNRARTPAFGSNSYLNFPDRAVAVKTGTTNDYHDAWIIGYTPDIAVGAWAGNNDNTAMEKKVAGFIVAPMWNAFITKYFELHPEDHPFTAPAPLDPSLKPVLRGYKIEATQIGTTTASGTDMVSGPQPHSILHYIQKDNPRGPAPQNPANDAQYPYWEYGILLWRLRSGAATLEDVLHENNTTETVSTSSKPVVRIKNPDDGDRVRLDDVVEVNVSVESEGAVTKVDYYVDGAIVGSTSNADTSFSFMPGEKGVTAGGHTLLVVVENEHGARGGASLDFRVR